MKVGFTGTREGMTNAQWEGLWSLIHWLKPTEFHHGDCVGADAQAHNLALHYGRTRIIIHPPTDESKRAFCRGAHEIRPSKLYFDRNRDIVDDTAILIAAPLSGVPQVRGGTWYTIRYASTLTRNPFVIWPDGKLEQRPRW